MSLRARRAFRRPAQMRFGEGRACAGVQDPSLGSDEANRRRQRAQETHLEFDGAVALARRQGSVDGASDRRVEHGRNPTAVDGAQRIEEPCGGTPLEDESALFEFHRPDVGDFAVAGRAAGPR